MVPQATPDRTVRDVETPRTVSATSSWPMETGEPRVTQEPADDKLEGPEMAWAGIIVLGTLLLLVSTGLGVAVALGIDFAAWLFGGALLVLVIVLEARVVDRAMLQTLTVNGKTTGRMS